MNIKSTYIHLLGNVLTSVAVVVGGLMMQFWDVLWVVLLIYFYCFYIFASFMLIKEIIEVLMQFAPKD